MSHRSKPFIAISKRAETLLREVMGIPENYKVLFMQGGASLQFAALPINLRCNRDGRLRSFRQFFHHRFQGGRKVHQGEHCRQQRSDRL